MELPVSSNSLTICFLPQSRFEEGDNGTKNDDVVVKCVGGAREEGRQTRQQLFCLPCALLFCHRVVSINFK